MDRQTLILQHLTGQDQMFGFLLDVLDAARPQFTPHRDKSKSLLADAQVVLVYLPPVALAHILHLVQVFWTDEGLGGSVAARILFDVIHPLVLVERGGSARGNVAFEEGRIAIVPFGALAGSIVLSKCLMTQQETDGEREENPEGSHYPAVLEWNRDFKEQTLHFTACFCLTWYVTGEVKQQE